MAKKDPRVDAYIAKSAPFAQPILQRLRAVVHAACPDVEETVKWGFPFFTHEGILCLISAFKQHCTFRFWLHGKLSREEGGELLTSLLRITALADLPKDAILKGWVQKAMKLNAAGGKLQRPKKPARRLPVPPEFIKHIGRDKKALANFKALSPGHQNEYVQWITGAKRDETKQRRMATALKWLAGGKPLNWKYEKTSGGA